MKILFVSMSAPYDTISHAGGQTLNFYIKKFASISDIKVDLVAYCPERDVSFIDTDQYGIENHLIIRKKNLKNIIGNIFSINSKYNPRHKYCNIMTWYASHLLRKELRNLKKNNYNPDIIIMEWTQITLQVDMIRKIFPSAKIVASEHDVTYLSSYRQAELCKKIFEKKYHRVRANNTKKREISALSSCDCVVTHNDKDRNLLIQDGIDSSVIHTIVPFYRVSTLHRNRKNNDIIFFGYMRRMENEAAVIWFIENVMFKLTNLDIRFVIIGGSPSERLLSYASDRIVVKGYVENTDIYFSEGMCFVAPLTYGAGIKVKVIEALYSGIPVLTNQIGIEGIPAISGKDYFHCESAEDYVNIISKIIDTKTDLISGKGCIVDNFDIEKSFLNYKEMLRKM